MSASDSGSEDGDYIADQRIRLLDKLKEDDTHHAILIAYANQIWQSLKIATTPVEKAELELFKLIKNKADKLQLRKQAQVVEDLQSLPQDETADDVEGNQQTPAIQQGSMNDKNEHPTQDGSDNEGPPTKRAKLASEAGAKAATALADQFDIDIHLNIDITDGDDGNSEAQQHKGAHSANRKRSSQPLRGLPQNTSRGSRRPTNIDNTIQNTSDQTTNKWMKRVRRAAPHDLTNHTFNYRAPYAVSDEDRDDDLPEIPVVRQTPVATSTARRPSQQPAQAVSRPATSKPKKPAPSNSRRKRAVPTPQFSESKAGDDDYVDDEDQRAMPPPPRRARARSPTPATTYVAAANDVLRRRVESNEFNEYRWEQIRHSVEENRRLTARAIAVGRPMPVQAALAGAQKPRLEPKDGVFFRTLYEAAKARLAEEKEAEQERLRNGKIGLLRYEDPDTGEIHWYESLEDGPVDFESPQKKFKSIREIWDEAWNPKPDNEPEGAVHFARPVDQPRPKLPAIMSGVKLGSADVYQSALDGILTRGGSVMNGSMQCGSVIGSRIGGSVAGSHTGSIRSLNPEQKFARSINKTSTVEEDAARIKDKGVRRDKWARLGLFPGGVKPVFPSAASPHGVPAAAGGLTAGNLRNHNVNAGGAVSNDPKTYAQRWQNDVSSVPESAASVDAGTLRSNVVGDQTLKQDGLERRTRQRVLGNIREALADQRDYREHMCVTASIRGRGPPRSHQWPPTHSGR